MNAPSRVLVADDHAPTRADVRDALEADPRFQVIAEAADDAPGSPPAQVEKVDILGDYADHCRSLVDLYDEETVHRFAARYTSLLDPNFASGLADFARATAERYPWIDAWTPVNEPLTTARFSALYGLWYPHHREERSFWLALLLASVFAVQFGLLPGNHITCLLHKACQ